MDKINFYDLLIKTAFCFMTSDGNIDNREIQIIEDLCAANPNFEGINVRQSIQELLELIKNESENFMSDYFKSIENLRLSPNQESVFVDFALNTILADDEIHYSEIKLLKKISKILSLNIEDIIKKFPDFEMYLGDDIATDNTQENLSKDFLTSLNLNFSRSNLDENKSE
jgi:uncharacterized tellurite resistance protein B-like protein